MANYATLKAAIADVIKTNGNNEITGALLQQALLSLITSLGAGYQYMGVATPSTNPGTPDQNVFYVAFEAGTYSNFDNAVLSGSSLGFFAYNGTWTINILKIPGFEEINNLNSIYADKAASIAIGRDVQVSVGGLSVYKDGAYMSIDGSIVTNDNHRILIMNVAGSVKISGQTVASYGVPAAVVKNGNSVIQTVPSVIGSFEFEFAQPLANGTQIYVNEYFYMTPGQSPLTAFTLSFPSADAGINIEKILNVIPSIDGLVSFHLSDLPGIGFINTSGTVTAPSETPWRHSDFLSVKPGTKINCNLNTGNNLAGLAFYSTNDESGFISCNTTANASEEKTIDVPANAYYFRFCSRIEYANTWLSCEQTAENSQRLVSLENRVTALENTTAGKIVTTKRWSSIGDSITWLNDHGGEGSRPDHGYQYYVQQRIIFGAFYNDGVNGATMVDYPYNSIRTADVYTIALGINDWSNTKLSAVGTLADYKNYQQGDDVNNTYAKAYRRMINKLRALNASCLIILCTPRRANTYIDSGGVQHMPDSCLGANNAGIYLHEFADLVKEIAAYEGLPVVDYYYNSGVDDSNLPSLCYDTNLHPNERGMQLMANMMYPEIEKLVR